MAKSAAPLPPGPKGTWLTGSLAEFRRDVFGFYERCARDFGPCVSFRPGWHLVCLLNSPEFIEHMLANTTQNFSKHNYIMRMLVPLLGNGLLTSEGSFWLRQRRLAQPAFQRQRIAAYGETMVAYTQRMVDRWQEGETRDLHGEMMRLALEITAKTLFGADVANESRAVGEALEILMHDFLARWDRLLTLPLWIPTPGNLRIRRSRQRLNEIIYQIIKQRRTTGENLGDLLSLLLHARDEDDGTGMTDRQLRDEVMTLFLAGHETTANALGWIWYLLAQNPEVETALAAELNNVLGGRTAAAADLPQLPYTEAVVLEALRLYPPIWWFGRLALHDFEIGGFRVPGGTMVLVSQWLMHRDPRYFEEPLRFRPERWLQGLAKQLPKYVYFPFGGGPRICIGKDFAMTEIALVLATVVPRFRFSLAPGQAVEPRPAVSLRPAGGIQAVVHKK